MAIFYTLMPSPVGTLLLTATEHGLSGIHMEQGSKDLSKIPLDWIRDEPRFEGTVKCLNEYFSGERQDFSVPLDFEGTRFQEAVWSALRSIPYGTTMSYAEIARRIGNPKAVRAVGQANNRNPISIIVPCHRVVGSDGPLTGYGGGIERKKFLLDLETKCLADGRRNFC